MVVRRVLKTKTIVGGGGAIEVSLHNLLVNKYMSFFFFLKMELSRELRSFSRSISGKQQLIINSFAKALEAIPRTLAHNAGLDQVEILNKLRQKHYSNSCMA
jgi:T-complex protein 1 subunit eta